MEFEYDFCGWATKSDLRCGDGRIIEKGAFEHNDGKIVPLIWNHDHSDPKYVIGKALLEHKDGGVYAYAQFNDNPMGVEAKELVKHGDITNLSIYANRLQEVNNRVKHGEIREVSLVLAGANPGAHIEDVVKHADSDEGRAGMIFTDEELIHACGSVTTDKKKKSLEHAGEAGDKTVQEVLDTLTDEQREVVYALIGASLKQSGIDESEEGFLSHNNQEGNDNMKFNVFTANSQNGENNSDDRELTHSEMETILKDAKRHGSLKESFLAHAEQYGIKDIDILFPDAKSVTNTPEFIKRDTGWVSKVLNGTKHIPFSRIKSVFANITEDEARAKGYITGNLKKEEVFSLLKRTTDPQTIYKKQKLDRDDIIDIVDFDVVAWIKGEMRIMLDEEIARAILIGDGRLTSDEDHISEEHVRPIYKDADLFTVKVTTTATASSDEDAKAKDFIRTAIKSRKLYKGSGSPALYTTEDVVTDCLLLEDTTGRRIYDSVEQLARILRVSEIITVPVMEGMKGAKVGGDLLGIIVNLTDYRVGADKGGSINMFEDFDIDYNQQKYLMETRCSGALVKPYSAIAIETSI